MPESVPHELQKDLELVKLRLIECREPRELDLWLRSALRVAKALNPYLASDDLAPIWTRIMGSACYGELEEFQQRQHCYSRRSAHATPRAWPSSRRR